jgi:hypothetical protein
VVLALPALATAYAHHETRLAATTRLQRPRLRALVLGVGCAVPVGALAWVATFPVSISI